LLSLLQENLHKNNISLNSSNISAHPHVTISKLQYIVLIDLEKTDFHTF